MSAKKAKQKRKTGEAVSIKARREEKDFERQVSTVISTSLLRAVERVERRRRRIRAAFWAAFFAGALGSVAWIVYLIAA